jgi:hypothetical protein
LDKVVALNEGNDFGVNAGAFVMDPLAAAMTCETEVASFKGTLTTKG